MSKGLFWLPLLVFLCCSCGKETDAYVKELDDALRERNSYERLLNGRISVIRSLYIDQRDPGALYKINRQMADAYASYSLDSTVKYLNKNLILADSLSDRHKIVETELLLASEYNTAGYNVEASDILQKYGSSLIPDDLKLAYFTVCHSLAGETMAFTNSNEVFIERMAQRDNYRDSLFTLLPFQSFQWLDLKREAAEQSHDTEAARNYAWGMVQMSPENTHDYAKSCFFYQFYLSDQNGAPERIKWLCKSAIADVKCVTKDYAALNTLAMMLFENGDIERSFKYAADYCMPDALVFNGKLRPWQISQFFPKIEKAYRQRRQAQTNATRVLICVIACALVIMILMTYMIIRHQRSLVRVNGKLQAVNAQFLEANKVKQEYIALFLSRLSENINTTRLYKNHVLKYIRRGNDKYLIDEIESLPPIDDDIQQFYKMFDETFVNLYPGFVSKFNTLLLDGEKITPREGEILSPELRIYALIKLGISDSSKIASLLHYSANTIYNYRSKTKNKAKGDRDKFDSFVRSIE